MHSTPSDASSQPTITVRRGAIFVDGQLFGTVRGPHLDDIGHEWWTATATETAERGVVHARTRFSAITHLVATSRPARRVRP